jgi:hypothetical protein
VRRRGDQPVDWVLPRSRLLACRGEGLDRVGVRHPDNFTDKVIFRRCPTCRERNIVRDDDFTCALCNSALPAQWNFISG